MATACPWLILKYEVKGYDSAWGAIVLEIFIASPARLAAFNICFELLLFGFLDMKGNFLNLILMNLPLFITD